MKVTTSRFGEIEVQEQDIIHMNQGLIGFPELTNFVMLEHDKGSPFKWLQCLDDGAIAFVVMSPLSFKSDYLIEVTEEEISALELKNPDDAVILTIVTIPTEPKKMTANLKAPLIFNLENRTGKQLILKDSKFQTKHFILDEIKKEQKKTELDDMKKNIQNQKQAQTVNR